MKPAMLKEAYTKMRVEIDTKIKDAMGNYSLPNSISPVITSDFQLFEINTIF